MKVYTVDTTTLSGTSNYYDSMPYRKFYLVHQDDVEHIHKLVPWALVTSITSTVEASCKKHGVDVDNLEQYKVVIPIRVHATKDGIRLAKSFVTGSGAYKGWEGKDGRIMSDYFPVDTQLYTPKEVFTPVCNSCDNALLQVAGKCHIGSTFCTENLRISLDVVR